MLNEFNFLFNNDNINIEIDANGVAWFRAYEIARVLGYADTNVMMRSLNDNEKLIHQVHGSGQNRNIYFINEYGLYRIIMRASSKKPNVVEFQDKVFYDILPCIRKYGAYIDANTRQQLEANPNLIHNINANIDNHEKKRMYHLLHKDSPEHRMMQDNRRLRNELSHSNEERNNMIGMINYLEDTIDRINSYDDIDLDNYDEGIDYSEF